MAVEDADGDGGKEVYAYARGNGSDRFPQYFALSGTNGALLWRQQYALNATLRIHAEFGDADGDGKREILLIADNTIEARHPISGTLLRTFAFATNVNTFAISAPLDLAPPLPQVAWPLVMESTRTGLWSLGRPSAMARDIPCGGI
jgi:hypothetical protein